MFCSQTEIAYSAYWVISSILIPDTFKLTGLFSYINLSLQSTTPCLTTHKPHWISTHLWPNPTPKSSVCVYSVLFMSDLCMCGLCVVYACGALNDRSKVVCCSSFFSINIKKNAISLYEKKFSAQINSYVQVLLCD